MITLHGPDWPTIRTLRTTLRSAPETGTFRLGGAPLGAIAQLTAFRAAGLTTPDFTTDVAVAKTWVGGGSIVFGRRLIHTRGNDICLPKLSTGRWNLTWLAREWWSRYVPSTYEWRVHVFDGTSIARGRKHLTGRQWRRAPVRNVGNGWTFDFTITPPKGLRVAAKEALRACAYPHGAVDILEVVGTPPRLGKSPASTFVVLEVNRVPALTCPYTQAAWVAAIRRHITIGGVV